MLTIQDKAIIAVMEKGNPIGEALSRGALSTFPMTMSERQDMIQRLSGSVSQLLDDAQKTYQDNCYQPGTTNIDGDYIVRLSTNEFFFYTKEPLTLKEFEQIQNEIAEKAKIMSPGVQLILGSFGVQTDDGKVMNVTPHIACGTCPDFHFIVKNYTSSIDVRYKIPDGKGDTNTLPVLDQNHPSPFMPQITINEITKECTFNNIIPCKTPDGTPFITAIDICLDHAYGIAKKNYSTLAKKDRTILNQPVSHVVVSNCIDLKNENCIGSGVTHVDPRYSLSRCKAGASQQVGSSQKQLFGETLFKVVDVICTQVDKYIKIKNNYAYKTTDPSVGRNHKFFTTLNNVQFKKSPDLPEFEKFKSKYQAYKGDFLKNQILEDLKKRIEETTSLNELDDLKKELETSFEYDVLKAGQGWFTKTFGIKTSSQIALENMIEQQEKYLSCLDLKC
jgi:hypothetical protein